MPIGKEENNMKKYEATIGFVDRYTGTDYETVSFEAKNKKEAENTARSIGNQKAYQYCPDTFFVESVTEVR